MKGSRPQVLGSSNCGYLERKCRGIFWDMQGQEVQV